ncbi:MAG: hypothetical protein JNK23_06445 [Opitutaceae bacterium]|nr:hypothetical protein [Opitutaceae bacterium]
MKPRPTPLAARVFGRLLVAGFLGCMVLRGELRAQSDTSSGSGRSSGDGMPSMDIPRARPILLYFPPSPPPLGQMIPSVGAAPGRNAAPAGLAEFVSDIFYPALGVRLASRSLSEKQRARLDRYRADKAALQQELRVALEKLHDAEPATRDQELSKLARSQAPRLAALEQSAEDLRRDLVRGDETWSALREWRLGERVERGFSPNEIAQTMRGYAFYSNSVSPAQRRLLREIHLELTAAAHNTAHAAVAQPYLFFPPEPARVLLPDDLPAEVAAKVAAYQTKKSLLKKELYDAVFAEERLKLGLLRASPLKTLAAAQESALAELETIAEEIRRGLVQFAPPSAIAERSPLPPVLQARVGTLIARHTALQRDATTRLNELFAANRDVPMRTSVRFDPDGLKVIVIATQSGRGGGGKQPENLTRIATVRTQAAAIAEDYGRQIAEIVNETNALRAEITRTLGTTRGSALDAAFAAAARVAAARETAGLYGDYRIAVFQPGLSPAQRRLLLDGAVAAFALPLPSGELQPTGRLARW